MFSSHGAYEDPLVKREQFAISLRKEKRAKLQAKKRTVLAAKYSKQMGMVGSALSEMSLLLGRQENALINRVEAEFGPDKTLQHKLTKSLQYLVGLLENEPQALCHDTNRVIDVFDMMLELKRVIAEVAALV